MTEANTDEEVEAETEYETTVTLAKAIEFASERAGEEVESFEGDVPEHAAGLVVSRASNLLSTTTNVKMAEANEQAPDVEAEDISKALAEDVVDIIMALGALDYEYDLDIAGTFEERMELIEAYKDFNDAIEDAESQEEMMNAVDEHMTEELEEVMGGGMGQPMGSSPDIGDNVDAEDYDHAETERSYQ